MVSRNVIRFIEALDKDGTAQRLIDAISTIGASFPYHAQGKIIYTLNLELRNIQEYYCIDIELKFYDDFRNSRVVEARRITMDEYIGCYWSDDRELRETYFEMLKQFER